jgi:hypothetical protein
MSNIKSCLCLSVIFFLTLLVPIQSAMANNHPPPGIKFPASICPAGMYCATAAIDHFQNDCPDTGPGYPACIAAVQSDFNMCMTQCGIDHGCDTY